MADSVFKSKSLNDEEIRASYENALHQVDAQRLENHILQVMNPENEQIALKGASLDRSYARLVDDYENWKSENKPKELDKDKV